MAKKLQKGEYYALIDKWGNFKYHDCETKMPVITKRKGELQDDCPPVSSTREKQCRLMDFEDASPKWCKPCWEACGCRIIKVKLVEVIE